MPAAKRTSRRTHRLAFGMVLAAATWGLLEAGSLALFAPLTGAPFSPEALAGQRAERLAYLDPAAHGADGPATLYERHPYLGYAGRPGARSGGPNAVPYNDWGMKSRGGHAYPSTRADDTFVVAVLGGSVAEGFANKGEAALQRSLERLDPAFARRRVVLVSLATGGYKQPQQLIHLSYALLSGFEFDLVVNIDGFNDLVLSLENAERDLNPIHPSGFQMALVETSQSAGFEPESLSVLAALHAARERERRALAWAGWGWLRFSPFTQLLATRVATEAANESDALAIELAELAQSTAGHAVRGPRLPGMDAGAPPNARMDAVIEVWARASGMLDAVCRASGLRYLHVLQPNQYLEGSKPLSEQELRSAYDPDHAWSRIASSGYPALRARGAALVEAGVEYRDLSDVFEGVSETLYVDTCCHFNRRGYEIFADALAGMIVEGASWAGAAPTHAPSARTPSGEAP